MGEITKAAEEYWWKEVLHKGKKEAETYISDFVVPFKLIEKKLKGRDEKIEKLSKDVSTLFIEDYNKDKRIEALEAQYKEIYEMMASWETLKEIRKLKVEAGLTKPIATDKDGKPEGGLKRGDVISYYFDGDPGGYKGKILGQFCWTEEDRIYAYWQNLERNGLQKSPDFMRKDKVTFEFRPEHKEG